MWYGIPMGRKRNKPKAVKDPGLGFSPYRQSARMTQGPSDRLRTKRARAQWKRDIDKGNDQ
jgi:hypothetical protein